MAFIGLGVMGYPMAAHLARAGHSVSVYNRNRGQSPAWVAEFGGCAVATPCLAAQGAELVFMCVGNDDDVRAVVLGTSQGVGQRADDGAWRAWQMVQCWWTTPPPSADVARELHALACARGLHFIDAPVSGGQAGAQNGLLTVMCGGDGDAFARIEPVVMAYARACTLMGPAAQGS